MLMNDENVIKKCIEDSLKRRNHWDSVKDLLFDIYDLIIPKYKVTPYWTSNHLRQLRKIYFIEQLANLVPKIATEYCIPELIFAAVCTDLSLVANEFNPQYRVPSMGVKSAEIMVNDNDILLIMEKYFPYYKWKDELSMLPSIRSFKICNRNNKGGLNMNPPSRIAEPLCDIYYLSELFSIGFNTTLNYLIHDLMLLDNIDMADCTDEEFSTYSDKALRQMSIRYGDCGSYDIRTSVLSSSTVIVEKFNTIKGEIESKCNEMGIM